MNVILLCFEDCHAGWHSACVGNRTEGLDFYCCMCSCHGGGG